ncbi:unnamed protein product [Lactuca saligna]|uniref:Uncharacterized protein n=1 Tax=Lactuca saligna TaxID=75948 RepID=A0AA35UMH0_LACSI|nr:unnamed protein product [Lactuca saligna]
MGSINNGGGGGGGNHIIDAFGRLLTCVLRHMASELNLKMRTDELNLRCMECYHRWTPHCHPKAKAPELSAKKLFGDLPRLWHRDKAPQPKDAAQLALKKMPSAEQETISMSEYQRGVGAWNFDLEDLKFKASLVQDDDEIQDIKDHDVDSTSFANNEASNSKAITIGKHSTSDIESSDEVVPSESLINKESKLLETDDKGSIIVEEKSRK